jgi:hypothetical protein
MKPKIIIWGFPLDTHTHSYIHAAWYKTFKFLGYETYWFHDGNYPENFDYKNCLFISEEYAASKIPIEASSTYFIHNAINPSKYLDKGARLIDIRFNVYGINDVNYKLQVNKSELVKMDDVTFYNPRADDSVLADQWEKGISGYEAIHLTWATDLLPHEFYYDDALIRRHQEYYHVGSIIGSNIKEMQKVVSALQSLNIPFVHIDPWRNPVSFEDGKRYMQLSRLSLDVRGTETKEIVNGKPGNGGDHKNIGYIPCRTFKAISYGRITGTNSKAVKDVFGDYVIYNDDEYQLVYDMNEAEKKDKVQLVIESMRWVQENHTYINRVNCLMRVYNFEV